MKFPRCEVWIFPDSSEGWIWKAFFLKVNDTEFSRCMRSNAVEQESQQTMELRLTSTHNVFVHFLENILLDFNFWFIFIMKVLKWAHSEIMLIIIAWVTRDFHKRKYYEKDFNVLAHVKLTCCTRWKEHGLLYAT